MAVPIVQWAPIIATVLILQGCALLPEQTTLREFKRVPCPAVAVEVECPNDTARVDDWTRLTPAQIIQDWGHWRARGACLDAALDTWERAHADCFANEEKGWLW